MTKKEMRRKVRSAGDHDAGDGGHKAGKDVDDAEQVKGGEPLFVVGVLDGGQLPGNVADLTEGADGLGKGKAPKAPGQQVQKHRSGPGQHRKDHAALPASQLVCHDTGEQGGHGADDEVERDEKSDLNVGNALTFHVKAQIKAVQSVGDGPGGLEQHHRKGVGAPQSL